MKISIPKKNYREAFLSIRNKIGRFMRIVWNAISPSNNKRRATDLYDNVHFSLISRSFWGRSNFYKKVVHSSLVGITIFIFITGISTRLNTVNNSQGIVEAYDDQSGNIDSLAQGFNIKAEVTKTPNINFKVTEYTVKDGDSIDTIASSFKVTKDTLKWANPSKINFFTEKVGVGERILIPEISGVLYEIKDGDTIDSVISKTSGDRFEVIEINQLEAPNFTLASGSKILIPNGKLPPPPPPPPYFPVQATWRTPTDVGVGIFYAGRPDLNGVTFVNPLGNPGCNGYGWNRGFTTWHNGVDLGRNGGCWVRAAASGTVVYSGWSSYGEGYNVRIDHGNGVQSLYYHAETLWVRTGTQVTAGQEIMYMGCTGSCTGVHLHFGLKLNGGFIDSGPYVPY